MEVSGKKILYLVTKGNWGGAQRYVFDVATAAQQAGFEVVVGYGGSGTLAARLNQRGVRTIVIPGLARDVSGSDAGAYRHIAALIRAEKPDIVHLNSSKAAALGALAARLAGVPRIIVTDHGWAFMERRNFFARAAIWFVSWLTALMAHVIIAVSDFEARISRTLPFCAGKVVRIYNGIDLAMPFGTGEVIRRAFPPGVRITGTVGELTKNKNQRALIEEARGDPAMYLAIVGEGEERQTLEMLIQTYNLENRVKLFGFLPAQEVMRGFDEFVLPSTKEALAYVVLEARAAGIPIRANRVGGVGEALDQPLSTFSIGRMLEQTLALYNRR